jgi:hypothetical protein
MLKKNLKYKVVKGFLSQEVAKLAYLYLIFKHQNNRDLKNFDFDHIKNADTSFYGDSLMESLLHWSLKKMEEETELELWPTYSFTRMYTKFATLKKHTDRPACEISVTVQLGSCGTTKWPIYIDNTPIFLEDGDAVIYLGMELEHWREEFTGDHHAQVFLHYVDKNDKHAAEKFDRRRFLATQK